MITEATAQFPARLDSCEAIEQFVERVTQQAGLSEEQRHNVQLAVDEHFANLVEHAFADQPDSLITFACHHDDRQVQILISDPSVGFDPRNFVIPDVENTPIEELKPGGFGNYFISELMDEVEYIQRPDDDNTLILTVYRSHPS